MEKIKFGCDYLEGAHPRILQRLIETNYEQHEGYSEDTHCDAARQYILQRCPWQVLPGISSRFGQLSHS